MIEISETVLSILGSVIVAIATCFGVIYQTNKIQSKNDAIQDAKMQQIGEKIEALTRAQEKHNSVIERTFLIEKTVGEQQRDIKTLYHSTETLASDIKEVKSGVDKVQSEVHDIKVTEARLEEKIK